MASAPATPHDKLFKLTFSVPDNAIAELRSILPRTLLDRVDLSTLRVLPGEFVDEVLKSAHSDLLYSLRISGKPALLYLLFEHQSTQDAMLPLRLLRYVLRVLEGHAFASVEQGQAKGPRLPLPVVIPMVLHHGEAGWTVARRLEDLFDAELVADPELNPLIVRMGFVLDDISALSDVALKRRALTLTATLTLWALRDARNPERLIRTVEIWASSIVELVRAPNGRQATETLFRYITAVSELTAEQLTQKVLEVAPEVEDAIMTIAEQWEAKGRLQGQAEGRAQGQAEGRRDVLVRQLTLKFGELSDMARVRVTQASEEELTRWTERVLTATSIEQVFG